MLSIRGAASSTRRSARDLDVDDVGLGRVLALKDTRCRFRDQFARTSRVEFVDALGDRDAPGDDGVVSLALQLLPALGQEPCRVDRHGNVRSKDNLALTLDHFNLRSGLVQTENRVDSQVRS